MPERMRGGAPQSGRIVLFWLYYLIVAGVVARAFADSLYIGGFAPLPYALLSAFLVLGLLQPALSRRFPAMT